MYNFQSVNIKVHDREEHVYTICAYVSFTLVSKRIFSVYYKRNTVSYKVIQKFLTLYFPNINYRRVTIVRVRVFLFNNK